ncbi:MAG TPA: phosphatidylinositol-specific phospholipase C domain-containing protein [Actinomycetota bacterium]|nr:phosphatidylinositol-specific phospholipase C domain-containing protein [Actinomycetota bacterium]
MYTEYTILCLVNFSGSNIASMSAAVADNDNWDSVDPQDPNKMNRPDYNVTGALADGNALCVREEIAKYPNGNGCWFTVSVTFDGEQTPHQFKINQSDAYKQPGDSTTAFPGNAQLEVFQTQGEDSDAYTLAVYIRPAKAPDNSIWMTNLKAAHLGIKVNEITMPGSHDAGMYIQGNEQAVTQSLSIGAQLEAGSRYFDLRVYRSGDLKTYHGNTDGGTLSSILTDVSDFLTANSSETVILKFRAYYCESDVVAMVKSMLGNLLYKSTTTPNFAQLPLSALTGKVVAVCSRTFAPLFPAASPDPAPMDPSEGIHPYWDYGNEDTGQATPPGRTECFGVYDSYTNVKNFATMTADQHNKLAAHGGYGQDYLFLFSWTLTGKAGLFDLHLLSGAANGQMAKALTGIQTQTGPRPNIVYIDQIDPWLCSRIIAMNS